MSTSNLSIWRDRYWSDLSSQLHNLNIIDESNFDGPLLKKDTPNGAWLWSWLGRVYNYYSSTARETVTIQVVAPSDGSGAITLIQEGKVRRHEMRDVVTFPAAFGVVGDANKSEEVNKSEEPTAAASGISEVSAGKKPEV